jgi:2-hydroxy-3-keto-5-methylthiopentenyl-1-phosphate phosphatase
VNAPSPRLVLDWDGTVTAQDTLHVAIAHFGDVGVFRRLEEEHGRSLTIHEVIAVEMETITAPLAEVTAYLVEHVPVRDGFRELVEQHDPLIVSAGFVELIEPVLLREGVEARVLANRLDPSPQGWRAVFRDDTPCTVCGEPCKRAAVLAGGDDVVFVGDGVSDRCAALAARRVFARDGLARWLDEQGVRYEPFEDLNDIALQWREPRAKGSE